MQALTPSLYLSVENRTRELEAKLLVACAAAERGISVVVGQQWLLNTNLGNMPPGIVYFKGMNNVQLTNMRRARICGHRVVANDEECAGVATRTYMIRDISPHVAEFCDQLHAQGEEHREAILIQMPKAKDKIRMVGNPRLDILRPEFSNLYQDEAKKIRDNYGRFILIDTNFGNTNSAWGSLEEYFAVCVRIGWIDPKSPEDMALFDRLINWELSNRSAIADLIEILLARFPDHLVIVRPHPSERINTWHEKYGLRQGIKIIHEGSHIPWIMASEVMIHTGCTTGMEAMVARQPVIGICPGKSEWHDHFISNDVNITAPDAAAAADILDAYFRGDNPFERERERLLGRLRYHFTSVEQGFAFDQTVNCLMELYEQDPRGRSNYAWTPLPGFKSVIPRSDYFTRKMKAGASEIQVLLNRYRRLLGRFTDIELREIGDSLFVIEKNR